MSFTSIQFGVFFVIVFILHWYVFSRTIKLQNIFLLATSYLFYAFWDWRYVGLLLACSVVPFISAKLIDRARPSFARRSILIVALAIHLGLLAFYKYHNFFIDSFVKALSAMGMQLQFFPLSIILPVGISFYTFIAIGYLLDVYNKKIKAARDPGSFFLFLGFFPHLLAGPIGRAQDLLPQFERKREFLYEKAVDGAKQILWGLFKKIVIADGCAIYTERIFNNYGTLPGSTVFFGLIYFGIQIYADFSGYSDIAIGMGKLLGIDLMRNFAAPYFSGNIAEFWRRWHMSLSFWFRDYLFLPLAYSINRKIKQAKLLHIKAETWAYVIAILCTWFLVGLWHGGSANYILWGTMHGIMLVGYHFFKQMKRGRKRIKLAGSSKLFEIMSVILTFLLVQASWVFFKCEGFSQAVSFLNRIPRKSLFSRPLDIGTYLLFIVLAFGLVEWIQRNREHAMQFSRIKKPVLKWCVYYFVILSILFFLNKEQTFIYMQF